MRRLTSSREKEANQRMRIRVLLRLSASFVTDDEAVTVFKEPS